MVYFHVIIYSVYEINRISLAANAPDITLPHEVGHSLGLKDYYKNGGNKGSLMDYPPTRMLIPRDVDIIWERAAEKY